MSATIDPGDSVTARLTYTIDTGEKPITGTTDPDGRLRHSTGEFEALVFKCYDSLIDGRARFTAHGSFDDPGTPADAPPRESIEVRTLALWGSA